MSDGKLRPKEVKSNVIKEVFGLLLLIVGVMLVIAGVGIVWGKGGILILLGTACTWVGVRLCIYKSEKG